MVIDNQVWIALTVIQLTLSKMDELTMANNVSDVKIVVVNLSIILRVSQFLA